MKADWKREIETVCNQSFCRGTCLILQGVRCLRVSKGRYDGTYGVLEVAFHFAMWLSPKFHLLVVGHRMEYFRLLAAEYC